jgi:hypothetical protein
MIDASSADALQHLWTDLNLRYFAGKLPPIPIEWSRRLTSSAGMFIGREGPRSHGLRKDPANARRVIRLSVPLLTPGSDRGFVRTTLAHEMIHQWQYDVLKRWPNHGPDFCRKMRELNRDGLAITIRHRMDRPVQPRTGYPAPPVLERLQRLNRGVKLNLPTQLPLPFAASSLPPVHGI